MSRLLIGFQSVVLAVSAQTPMGGPSLGFIFDAKGQALLPILGLPGAAVFGDPLPSMAAVSTAAVSSRQNVAVVNSGGWNAMILSKSGGTRTVALPAGLPASAGIAVSEKGAVAAFYDSTNNALTVVTGIAASFTAGSRVSANPVSLAALPGSITAFAVGDDGSVLASSPISAGGEALFRIAPDGTTLQLLTLQATASILVWHNGADALVTDSGANQIWSVQNPGSSGTTALLASDVDGVSGPVGAALSADGTWLWIANEGNQDVLGIDLKSRVSVSLAVGFHLTTMAPMGDRSSFRLNHLRKGPVWILDTAPDSGPRIVFIPAPLPANVSTEAAQ